MVGITKKSHPILKVSYSTLLGKFQDYQAMPEIVYMGNGNYRFDDELWCIKMLRNSGGLTESEARMVENLLSKLNDEGKKAIEMRLILDRKGDHHRGLDRLVNKYQRPTIFVPIDGTEIFQKDYLRLKIVGDEITWEEGSILEELQLEEASSMPML